MTPEPRPARPLRDLMLALLRSPLIALPFAAFFVLVTGQPWRAFGRMWAVTTVFAAATSFATWLVRQGLQDRIEARFAGDPRVRFVQGGTYALACLLAVIAAGAVMNYTLLPGLLGSSRAIATLLAYALLFAVLFTGLALAAAFYRAALERAGAERELQLARRIQRSFLLSEFPARSRLDVHAVNVSSREVSGDFYDVVPTPDGGLMLVIADVSGKGVPAALLSSMLQASLRTQAGAAAAPAPMVRAINALACQRDTTGQFATCFLAAVHEPTLTLRYTNAGHNLPVLLRADGTRVLLDRGGLLVGMLQGVAYEEAVLPLRTGDLLLLYTDGVTEAMNAAEELYGEDRLRQFLRDPADSPRALVDGVIADVRRHTGEVDQSDDITLLAVTYRGKRDG